MKDRALVMLQTEDVLFPVDDDLPMVLAGWLFHGAPGVGCCCCSSARGGLSASHLAMRWLTLLTASLQHIRQPQYVTLVARQPYHSNTIAFETVGGVAEP